MNPFNSNPYTERQKSVSIRSNISGTTTLSTGIPQGCVLSPLLPTLLTAATHSSNHIINFATVVGIESEDAESAHGAEVKRPTDRCRVDNLSLNLDQTKETTGDQQLPTEQSHVFCGDHQEAPSSSSDPSTPVPLTRKSSSFSTAASHRLTDSPSRRLAVLLSLYYSSSRSRVSLSQTQLQTYNTRGNVTLSHTHRDCTA